MGVSTKEEYADKIAYTETLRERSGSWKANW